MMHGGYSSRAAARAAHPKAIIVWRGREWVAFDRHDEYEADKIAAAVHRGENPPVAVLRFSPTDLEV